MDSNLEHKKQKSYFNTIDSLYLLAVFGLNYHGDAISCPSRRGWVLPDPGGEVTDGAVWLCG